MVRSTLMARFGGAALGLVTALGLAGCGPSSDDGPVSKGGPLEVRRLTEPEYRHIIADVFGKNINIGGRFEPDLRDAGLIAVGTAHESVTASGMEQYDIIARDIADQVVDETHRDTLIGCKPAKASDADDACAGKFLAKTGRLLFRRPLTQQELQAAVKDASDGAKKLGGFYPGLSASLAGLLVSPQFLFRHEVAEADPNHSGQYRLDPYSMAQRLSFFLWDTAPDTELLDAAQKGELDTKTGLEKQVDRMIASPRLVDGARGFFTDMLGFDAFNSLAKDPTLYPKYSSQVAHDAQEQTLRTITDLVVTQKGDYRDIFTTRKTFLTRLLGSVYDVPVSVESGWEAHEYPDGDPHAGIVSEISFVALHSHPGRSSSTLRGKAVRQILLCQKVPDPPGNVNFTVVQETNNPKYKTARERLVAHRTEATCAGCHKLIDPIGLAMENFDTVGEYRTTENGAPIDASGEFDGKPFTGMQGLGQALHDNPQASACVVNRLFEYSSGHPATKDDTELMKYLQQQFVASGYKIPAIMRTIVTTPAFYRISTPGTEAGGVTLSSAETTPRQEVSK